jgi:hypothetical protein
MKNLYLSFSLLLMLVFTSCEPYYYLPTKQNVMVFEKKGDAVLAVSSGNYSGSGIEAGYAITNNIGLYTSLNTFNITNRDRNAGFGNDYIWDNEVMYFKKYSSGLYTGLNVGVGLGQLNQDNVYYNLGLNRQFIQPSVGITRYGFFEMAFSLRFSHLSYSLTPLMNLESDYDRYMFNQYFTFNGLLNSDYYFIEPALTMGFTYNFLKLQLQLVNTYKTNHEADFYIRNNLITSLSINLNKLLFNTKK